MRLAQRLVHADAYADAAYVDAYAYADNYADAHAVDGPEEEEE